MQVRLYFLFALLTLLPAGQSLHAQNADSVRALLQYTKPGSLQISSTSQEGNILVREVTFTTDRGQMADAWWVSPVEARKGYALVILMHWGGGNKDYFKEEAVALAQRGFHAVSVNAPWHWRTYDTSLSFLRTYPDNIMASTKAVRQVIDLAQTDRGFSGKAYYIGHSFGATLGGLLLGNEPRIKGAVFMAGLASLSHSITEDPKGFWKRDKAERKPLLDSVVHRLRVMEPEDFINNSKAPVFYQAASNDQYVTAAQSNRYIKAIKRLSLVRWYPTDHLFEDAAARRDRLQWITQQSRR